MLWILAIMWACFYCGPVAASLSWDINPPARTDSVPISIRSYFNSRATSVDGETDGVGMKDGATLPSVYLPSGLWMHQEIQFQMPEYSHAVDNIRANGQIIEIHDPVNATAVHMILTGEDPLGFLRGESHQVFGLIFADGSEIEIGILVRNWFAIHGTNKSPIRVPYHFDGPGIRNYNVSHLFHAEIPLPPTTSRLDLTGVRLPPTPLAGWNTAHIFAMSVVRAPATPAYLDASNKIVARQATATRRWEDIHDVRAQVVEITLHNPYSSSLSHDHRLWLNEPLSVTLESPDFVTLRSATLTRMMPGGESTVEVLIKPTSAAASFEDVEIVFHAGISWRLPLGIDGAKMVHDWQSWNDTPGDIEQHSAPKWWSGAKFGIFIHWGPYSVPAWTDANKYAEWYDWWLHEEGPDGTTYKHHLDHYGPDFVYDDFFSQFMGERFNASAWVDLIARAGARYFALTTKHHDGYALFDTAHTSDRSSVKLGPRRDFLKELMHAAQTERPTLKRGTYFSMPEWFHPDYRTHGKVLFPGGLAHNPYRPNMTEAYTGYIPVDDYLDQVQKEQMRILAFDYETDLMWCDIGLENKSYEFAAEWFSKSAKQGRQVAINNRCGIGGDFDTPEMTTFDLVQKTPWESNMGIDPYSFGFNKLTAAEEYRNASDIIHTLVDIVSKGGNFLLNIGPNSAGEIIPAMSMPLLEAGSWLEKYGEAIYDTHPHIMLPESEGEVRLRFTQTIRSFYMIALTRPPSEWTITAPVPILEGDRILLLHGQGQETLLQWERTGEGIMIHWNHNSDENIAWVFKIAYAVGTQIPLRDEL